MLFHHLILRSRRLVCALVLSLALQPAQVAWATVNAFSGIWDPTLAANGFQLTAADPSGSATMALSADNQILTANVALSACYRGCGAFSLSNSGALGTLPFGLVQFDWSVTTYDFTEDAQININGADSTISSPGTWLYPYATNTGSALIDYEGGTLSLFDVTFGGYDTGAATATITLSNFSAPDGPSLAQADTPAAVLEPSGWTVLLAALLLLRRRRPGTGDDNITIAAGGQNRQSRC